MEITQQQTTKPLYRIAFFTCVQFKPPGRASNIRLVKSVSDEFVLADINDPLFQKEFQF